MQTFTPGYQLTLDFSKGPDAQGFSEDIMPDLDKGGAPASRVGGPVGHLDVVVSRKMLFVRSPCFEICVFDIEYLAKQQSTKMRCQCDTNCDENKL